MTTSEVENNINRLKIELFDIIRQSEALNNLRVQKLQELQTLENLRRQQPMTPVSPISPISPIPDTTQKPTEIK